MFLGQVEVSICDFLRQQNPSCSMPRVSRELLEPAGPSIWSSSTSLTTLTALEFLGFVQYPSLGEILALGKRIRMHHGSGRPGFHAGAHLPVFVMEGVQNAFDPIWPGGFLIDDRAMGVRQNGMWLQIPSCKAHKNLFTVLVNRNMISCRGHRL